MRLACCSQLQVQQLSQLLWFFPLTNLQQQENSSVQNTTNVTRKVVNRDLLLDVGAFAERLVYDNFEGFGQEGLSFRVINESLFGFLQRAVCCR